jgi:hypothetical protein
VTSLLPHSVSGLTGELLSGLGAVTLDADGEVRHRPVLVDPAAGADAGAEGIAAAALAVAEFPAVSIAVLRADGGSPAPELLEAVSLTLAPVDHPAAADRRVVPVVDVDAALDEITLSITANPASTALLNELLRAGEHGTVLEALRLESLTYSTLLAGAEFARWLSGRGPKAAPERPAQPVLFDRDGDLLRVTLNHPARRNAFSAALRDELVAALTVAVADPSIAEVRLDAVGPNFCSGGDLAEFGTVSDPVRAHIIRTDQSVGRLITALGDRITVVVHGSCVGAGVELPAFARRVVARPDTTLRLPEIAMGLIPGAGGTASIPRRIGRWRTAYLALAGTSIDAEQALAWGLVDEIAD